MEFLQSFGIPIAALVVGGVMLLTLMMVAKNYKKCPPNKVLVVYGRKKKDAATNVVKGYRLITGGSAFVLPLLESHVFIGLENFSVESSVQETPNVDGVPVSVNATANVKVSSNSALLGNAVERMLGKGQEEIHTMLRVTLDGLLRQIIGKLTIEDMVSNREAIAQQVLTHAQSELNKLGFEIDNFVINHVADSQGYIKAMGAKRTAEVLRDATIAKAEADREATVRSSAARQTAESARLKSEEEIAQANRDLSLKNASFKEETEKASAKADMAGNLERAAIDKDLRQRQVQAEEAETTARIALAEQEAQRVEKELVYTKIRPAEAERDAAIIKADANSKSATITAEGNANAAVKQAEATKAEADALKVKLTLEGEGHAAADSARQRQMGLAEAEVTQKRGEAEAASTRAKGEAEAWGLQKKNEALAAMSEGARFIVTLEMLPGIIEQVGDAGQKIVGAAFEQVGAGLARIDNVHIVDLGGGGAGGQNPLAKFGLAVPEIVFGMLAKAQALGMDFGAILEKLGVPPGALDGILSTLTQQASAAASVPGDDPQV